VNKRERYVVVDADNVSRDTVAICAAVFDVLGPDVATAEVDAYSDFDDQMPSDIRAAEGWLRELGMRDAASDPGIGVVVPRSDLVGWAIALAYAPWATRVALHDAAGVSLAALEDGAHLVTVELDAGRALELGSVLGPECVLLPIVDWVNA
jgi:hypothetical protein